MYLKIQHFVIFTTIIGLASCKQEAYTLSKIEGKILPIDSSYTANKAITAFVLPYKTRINQVLDSTLTYAPYAITKTDGELNTTAGNLMADIVLSEASPIFKSRTNKEIDFVMMNHGGIRAVISQGNVSARNAFEIMPFENSIVVAELSSSDVRDMVSFLTRSGRAHPIAGLQVIINKDKEIKSIKIKGEPIDEEKTYYVATSDYLVSGGNTMGFFKNNTSITDIDYLIRNAMIDYFKKVDTLAPKVDDRYFIEN